MSVETDFDAAHFLRGYGGKCERMHGHRFRVVAAMRFDRLDQVGLSYDFAELKRHLNEVAGRFDHVPLNETPPFDAMNPSSENIARTIYQELKGRLGAVAANLHSIQVWESPGAQATYSE